MQRSFLPRPTPVKLAIPAGPLPPKTKPKHAGMVPAIEIEAGPIAVRVNDGADAALVERISGVLALNIVDTGDTGDSGGPGCPNGASARRSDKAQCHEWL